MQKFHIALAIAGTLVTLDSSAQFANSVVSYTPGNISQSPTDPSAALGRPSRATHDPDPTWGGDYPVDPFGPAYLASQIVSVGAGGSLTLHLDTPIQNNPGHLFGSDFIIFGNSSFIITNGFDQYYNYIGTPSTAGALLGNNTGSTRVSVSADGSTWYTLNPLLAPTVDGFFPTDGNGDPLMPVNPALTGADFGGLGLDGIRSLYGGSAGGTGFDLGWAQDGDGNSVVLSIANYVRIDVLSGKSEIDGIAVVPEPASLTLVGISAVILVWNRRRKN